VTLGVGREDAKGGTTPALVSPALDSVLTQFVVDVVVPLLVARLRNRMLRREVPLREEDGELKTAA
jgi:hypothetical protein